MNDNVKVVIPLVLIILGIIGIFYFVSIIGNTTGYTQGFVYNSNHSGFAPDSCGYFRYFDNGTGVFESQAPYTMTTSNGNVYFHCK